MLWVFPTSSKQSPFRIIRFILKTLNNEQHPCKRVRVDEYGALEISTDFTNLLVEESKISMEITGGNASWINGNNERHSKSIHNMVGAGLLDSNQHAKKW